MIFQKENNFISLPLENHVSTYNCIVFGENWTDRRSNYMINVVGKKMIQFRKKCIHKQSFQVVYVVEDGFKTLVTAVCPTADTRETEHKDIEHGFA